MSNPKDYPIVRIKFDWESAQPLDSTQIKALHRWLDYLIDRSMTGYSATMVLFEDSQYFELPGD